MGWASEVSAAQTTWVFLRVGQSVNSYGSSMVPHSSFARRAALVLALAGLSGCAVSPATQAARARDWPRLEKLLAEEDRAGKLDAGEAKDVAEAVASGEIRVAKGDRGVSLVESLGACAARLEDPLDDRFDKADDVGAAAGSVLLTAGLVDNDEYSRFALDGDQRAPFRALGARSLVLEKHLDKRRPFFRDLDERVRLSALRAANDFTSPADFDAVLEAARLDPLPLARAVAVRALGRIGGKRSVEALRDLWPRAEPSLREVIADAWAAPESFDAGGREELVYVAQHETGECAIAAAIELADRAPPGSPDAAAGLGVVIRAIKLGARPERVFAISAAPPHPDVFAAIRASKDDTDEAVAIAALSRIYREGAGKEQKDAREKLFGIAKGDAPEAPRARDDLAAFGDQRVSPLLTKALASKSAFARAYAARGLVSLGAYPKAAKALADRDADVRLQVACSILAAHN